MCKRCLEAINECPDIIKTKKDFFIDPFPEGTNGFVYFFATEDLTKIKIGYSKHRPYTRMEEYQKYQDQHLHMVAIWPVINKNTERKIHEHFKQYRISKDSEWFVYDWKVCSFLKALWNQFSRGFTYPEINELWGIK